MPDLKKVIRGLACCTDHDHRADCYGCYQEGPGLGFACRESLMRDALALLNGQTAQWIWDRPHHFRCSGCNGVVGQRTYLYCPNCGREMLLSETERRKEWPEEVSGDAD